MPVFPPVPAGAPPSSQSSGSSPFSVPQRFVIFKFAEVDPRIDGIDGADLAQASDCPIRFRRVGPATTDWVIDGIGVTHALVASFTDLEVEALCRGFTRQPLLNFLPSYLATPDFANNRMTEHLQGAHLDHHGDPDEAFVEPGPLFGGVGPYGYQLSQKNETESWFGCDDLDAYKFGAGSGVIGTIGSCTKWSKGGDVVSKLEHGGADKGFAWSLDFDENKGGGKLSSTFYGDGPPDPAHRDLLPSDPDSPSLATGQLLYVDLGINTDEDYQFNGIDGHEEYKNAATDITQPDPPGNLDDDVEFGFVHSNTGGLRHAYGDTQWMKLVVWLGEAAENYATHRAAIRRGFQAMLGGARQTYYNPQTLGPRVTEEAHAEVNLNAWINFHADYDLPDTLQVSVSFQIGTGAGGGGGRVEVQKTRDDTFATFTTLPLKVEHTTSLDASVLPTYTTGAVTFLVLPGEFVRFKTTDEGGTVSYTDPVTPWVTRFR